MHQTQIDFCLRIKGLYPKQFKNINVLDAGSLDINGNNRYLFEDCQYTGVDIGEGKNVDIVMPVHEYLSDKRNIYDTIISTEMLEHDRHLKASLLTMQWALKPGGLLLLTAAGIGRKEHGTKDKKPNDSPFTNDYYQPVTEEILEKLLPQNKFKFYLIEHNEKKKDIYFAGIKI